MNDEITKKKKDWLYRYLNNQRNVQRLQDKLETLEERIVSVKTPDYSGMPGGGTPITIDSLLADKEELENRIRRLASKGAKIKREILDVIDTIENEKQADILEYWFIHGYKAEEIDEILNFSTAYIYRLYTRAINKLNIPGITNDKV